MSKKIWLTLFIIFLIMFGLNYLMPLCFGDDYIYAFIWPGQSMYIPLPEGVERVSGFRDIIVSQWSHYLTGNGRTPAHLLVQFFVWQDKLLFDIFNSLIFVFLILEIYWISNKGEVTFKKIDIMPLCFIFFSLWAFTINFAGVFLWISGACNYLWMMALVLSFLILYVRKYQQMKKTFDQSGLKKYFVFIWGLLAGWTNENTICWIILILGLWLLLNRKLKEVEIWMWCGLVGLCGGYLFLIFAPGNIIRASSYVNVNIYSWSHMRSKLLMLGLLEFFQIFLWFFIFKARRTIRNVKVTEEGLKLLTLVKTFCALNLLSNGIMLLTPEFHARSGFASLVFLTIAVTLLVCNQSIFNVKFLDNYTRTFLLLISSSFFLVTLCCTYAGMYSTNRYNQCVIMAVQQHKSSGLSTVLEIAAPSEHSGTLALASGWHIVQPTLKEDEYDWKNVAFARYYGIKGIRMLKDKERTESADDYNFKME